MNENLYLRYISPFNISPPHFVSLQECGDITRSMRKHGWKGRAILAMYMNGKLQAITGSHRIKSARKSGIKKIPVAIIKREVVAELRDLGMKNSNFIDFFYWNKSKKWKKYKGINHLMSNEKA